jgi:hypothetical protein
MIDVIRVTLQLRTLLFGGRCSTLVAANVVYASQDRLALDVYGQSAKVRLGFDRPVLPRVATRRRQAPGASPACLLKKRLK